MEFIENQSEEPSPSEEESPSAPKPLSTIQKIFRGMGYLIGGLEYLLGFIFLLAYLILPYCLLKVTGDFEKMYEEEGRRTFPITDFVISLPGWFYFLFFYGLLALLFLSLKSENKWVKEEGPFLFFFLLIIPGAIYIIAMFMPLVGTISKL